MSTIGFDDLFDKEGFNTGLKALKDAIDAITRTINETKTVADGFSKTMGEELKNKINQLSSTSSNFDTELKKIRADFEAFKQSVAQTNNTLDQYKKTNEDLTNKVKNLEEQTKKYTTAQQGASKAASEGGITMKGLSQQLLGVASGAALVYKGISMLKEQILLAINSAIDFEKAMKEVEAITRASSTGIKLLTDDANRLGAITEKTAIQIAGLQKELGKLGFNTTEILASTDAIVDLSTATGESLSGSATVAAATLRAFGLDAVEMTRVVDVMAGSFVRSGLDLEKFRESMKLVAPIARATNIDIETTTASLSKLADAGLSGSLAGTALRNLFSNMADPTSDLSKRLGFTVQNSEDLIRAFKKLRDEGVGLAEAVQLVDVRARPAFFTLLNQVDAVEGLALEYRALNGEATDLADKMRDNLANDIAIANSAFDAMRRNIAEQFIPNMRQATQGITVFTEAIRFFTRDLFETKKAFDALNPTLEKTYGILQPIIDLWNKFSEGVSDYVKDNQLNESLTNTTTLLSTLGDELSGLDSLTNTFEKVKRMNVNKDYAELKDILTGLGASYEDILENLEKGTIKESALSAQLQVRLEQTLRSQKASIEQQRNSLELLDRDISRLRKKRELIGQINNETDVLKTEEDIKNQEKLKDIDFELLTLGQKREKIAEFLNEHGAKAVRLEELLKIKLDTSNKSYDERAKKVTDLVTLELQLQLEQSKTAEKAFETESAASDSWMRRLDLAKGYLAEREKQIFLEYQLELRKIELTEDGEEQSQLKRLIAVEKYLQKVQALEREYNKDFVKASDDIATAAQKNGQKVLEQSMKNFDEFWGIKRKKTKDNAEKEGAILERSFQRSFNIILGSVRRATDTLFDYLGKRFERELAEVDAWEKERIKLAGDNEEAILAIEEEASRRRAAIKKREARQDKAQAIFNIALNTAQAVVAALATIKGIALIPFIVALGAAQAAAVVATPIPEFAKGTTNAPEGQAIVGEKGREIVWDKRSNTTYVTPDAPTLTYLSKGSVVIPNDQTERILSTKVDRNEIAYDKTTISNNRKKEGADLYKLGGMFKEAVREIPLHQTTFDADGVREFVKRGNNRTERLNRRYKY
jgi:TP901 family phage tail tape measure protein